MQVLGENDINDIEVVGGKESVDKFGGDGKSKPDTNGGESRAKSNKRGKRGKRGKGDLVGESKSSNSPRVKEFMQRIRDRDSK